MTHPFFTASDFIGWASVENPEDKPSVEEWVAIRANALLEERGIQLAKVGNLQGLWTDKIPEGENGTALLVCQREIGEGEK